MISLRRPARSGKLLASFFDGENDCRETSFVLAKFDMRLSDVKLKKKFDWQIRRFLSQSRHSCYSAASFKFQAKAGNKLKEFLCEESLEKIKFSPLS